MEKMKKVGILLIILIMTLSNGWIEVIYAEGSLLNHDVEDALDISVDSPVEVNEEADIESPSESDESSELESNIESDSNNTESNSKHDEITEGNSVSKGDSIETNDEDVEDNKEEPASFNMLNSQPSKHLFAGYDFSGVVMEDGSIWTWGANGLGQLGLGDNDNRLHPVKMNHVLESRDIKYILGGSQNTAALTEDGDVYLWGQGTLSMTTPNYPRVSTPKVKIKDISYLMHGGDGRPPLNNNHSSFMLTGEDGRAYLVGSTYQGQAGNGLTRYGSHGFCNRSYNYIPSNTKPVMTSVNITDCANGSGYKTFTGTPLENVKMTAAVFYRGYVAVTESNEIYTWGNPLAGTTARKNNNANTIQGDIVEITATGSEIFALTDRGEVWKWAGATGTPVKESISNIKSIVSYGNTVALVTHDGKVYGKGNNTHGQLGNFGDNIANFTLIGSNVKQMALGYRHSLFEDMSGKIYGQGWNGYRQLANSDDGVKEEFVKVPGLSNISKVSTEDTNSYAVKNNRELFAWGNLNGGDLGSPTNAPRKITTFEADVVRMDSNRNPVTNATGVMLDNNKVYSWGHGNTSNLGHNTIGYIIDEIVHNPNNRAYTPNTYNGRTYVVKDKLGSTHDDITPIDFTIGSDGGVAINKKGQLLTWGRAQSGLWGIGETHYRDGGAQGRVAKYSTAYIKAKSNEKFTKVHGVYSTRLALQEEGYVYSWGSNSNLAAGDPNSNVLLPERIPGLSNIVDIDIGYETGMALDNQGNLYTWGSNYEGQIGNGTVGDGRGIVNISGLSGLKFERIFSGKTSMFAVTDDGSLYAWGDNRYGQLGLGGRFNRTSPRKVDGLPGKVVDVDNGAEHTLVLLDNGDVYAAGADTYGQLGLGAEPSKIAYQEIPFPDYITLQTNDNQEMQAGDTLSLNGYVTSVISGNELEVSYEIESASGVVESGKIKDMVSTTTNNYFDKTIKLDNKYPIGGYTVNISVYNKTSGLTNVQTISFGVVDNIKPTPPKVNANTEWTNDDVNVSITEGTDNESGVDYTEYRINNDEWERYRGPFTISNEGSSEIETRTADRAGNLSSLVKATVKIDKGLPTATITANITEDTHENIKLNIDASDNLSGIKSVTYLGDNIIKNSDFKDGLEHWHEDKSPTVPIGGGDISIRNGYLYLGDSRVGQNKAEQRDAFIDTAVGTNLYALVEARGTGILNARYAMSTGTQQTNYAIRPSSHTEFKEYKFGITRGEGARDVFMVERRSLDGWLEIRSVKVYAEKDITDTGVLEVTRNGTYSFIIEDNAGNIVTESFTVDNIVREIEFNKPMIDSSVEVSLQENMNTELAIGDIEVVDWRDNNNDWRLSLQATQLKNELNTLPKGTLSIKGVDNVNKTDGNKSGSIRYIESEETIDDGVVEIVNATNERGIYNIRFKGGALKLNLTPDMLKGIYNTKLEWTLNSTPEIN